MICHGGGLNPYMGGELVSRLRNDLALSNKLNLPFQVLVRYQVSQMAIKCPGGFARCHFFSWSLRVGCKPKFQVHGGRSIERHLKPLFNMYDDLYAVRCNPNHWNAILWSKTGLLWAHISHLKSAATQFLEIVWCRKIIDLSNELICIFPAQRTAKLPVVKIRGMTD